MNSKNSRRVFVKISALTFSWMKKKKENKSLFPNGKYVDWSIWSNAKKATVCSIKHAYIGPVICGGYKTQFISLLYSSNSCLFYK